MSSMSVETLFTLDDRLMSAAQQYANLEPVETLEGDKKEPLSSACLAPKHPCAGFRTVLPALYWVERSLRFGVVDSLVKLNPALIPDASVHAYHLSQLAEQSRFANNSLTSIEHLIEVFNLKPKLVREGVVGQELPVSRTLFGQFGGYCLFISQPDHQRSMAIGLMTGPRQTYVFDASIGLFKIETPQDLANMLAIWLESDQSIWCSAHYQLWRVTL